MGQVYDKALEFKRKHPGGVVWNLKRPLCSSGKTSKPR